MHKLSVPDCYIFIEEENKLSFNVDAILFNLSDIHKAKGFITFLQRNRVTILKLEIDKLIYLDSNTESFIYQMVLYFSQSSQRSLSLQVDADSNLQNILVKRLLILSQTIDISFTNTISL
jgi:hypothetical protein